MQPTRMTSVSLWRGRKTAHDTRWGTKQQPRIWPKIARWPACLALFVALAGSLTGCAGWYPTEKGYRQVLDTWIGSRGEELIGKWGLPTGEHISPDGTKLYEYKQERSYSIDGGTRREQILVDGHYVDVDIPLPDETQTTWCNTTFRIGLDDKIKSYYFNGPDCTAKEKSAN